LSLTPYLGIRDYGDPLMIVLILSAIILKERMRKRMVAGIILGLTGTAFLYYTVGQ
jgi:drug/metabolite transporter (DMT)-like permease